MKRLIYIFLVLVASCLIFPVFASAEVNNVTPKAQALLQLKTTSDISEQLRQVVNEQSQAQIQIQEEIQRIDSKNYLVTLMFGTNYEAIKNVKWLIAQNQLRIDRLGLLQTQLTNHWDISTVQEAIQALTQENKYLQDRISTEEQTKSIFGWLFKHFAQ